MCRQIAADEKGSTALPHLLAASAARTALAYLAGTLLAALAAVYAGITIARWGVYRIHHHREATR